MKITCRGCRAAFPLDQFPHRCPVCGGLFGFQDGLVFNAPERSPGLPGMWRYRESLALPAGAPLITLGEGDTPLVWSDFQGRRIGFKLESLNPTGSFKDRGSAVLVSWLLAAGVDSAVEDSSGNAGASFAAYASRAGMRGKVFVPATASGPKRFQIEAYGAEVIPVPGPRSRAAEAVLEAVQNGAVYASHAYLPQGTAGFATIAYELLEQIGKAPGAVLLPVGHGSLLLGIYLGFQALLAARVISRLPKLIGIQAAVCAPLWQADQEGWPQPHAVPEGKTLAEGVAIANPYHGQAVLEAVRDCAGFFLHVEEREILPAQKLLAQQGFYVEATSALVGAGLEQLTGEIPDPIIVIITGHGLKSVSTVA
jgi:threonine synthase